MSSGEDGDMGHEQYHAALFTVTFDQPLFVNGSVAFDTLSPEAGSDGDDHHYLYGIARLECGGKLFEAHPPLVPTARDTGGAVPLFLVPLNEPHEHPAHRLFAVFKCAPLPPVGPAERAAGRGGPPHADPHPPFPRATGKCAASRSHVSAPTALLQSSSWTTPFTVTQSTAWTRTCCPPASSPSRPKRSSPGGPPPASPTWLERYAPVAAPASPALAPWATYGGLPVSASPSPAASTSPSRTPPTTTTSTSAHSPAPRPRSRPGARRRRIVARAARVTAAARPVAAASRTRTRWLCRCCWRRRGASTLQVGVAAAAGAAAGG